ncbi:helix-turn-helix domain-containing protein [Paenibacillus lentus]|uniref:response regulator transcription factor n=1 Tax=Paenibacillus lentus TaxID=1338368 RepID=UPI003652FFC5
MRALIVDDEARVRKAVRLLVDWDAHGIDEILEAGSGNEAMELIRQSKPGLVIMDMMMASGHGMELMEWISEFADTVKFIVVSGHNDFDFVRNTVRHGGIDYILKPIDADAINSAVHKAVVQSREEERERIDIQRQNIQLNEFKPIYGEKLFSSLIDDENAAEASIRRLRNEGVVPMQADTVQLLLLQLDASDALLLKRFGHDSELMHFAIINICNEFLASNHSGIAFKYWGAPWEIVILIWNPSFDVQELIFRINEGLFHTLQRRMHFGIGSAGQLPHSLPAQYAEAKLALSRRNLLRSDSYAHLLGAESEDIAERHSQLAFSSAREEWKMAVLSGSDVQISAAAEKWVGELGRAGIVTPEQLHHWTSAVMLFRTQLLRETLGDTAGNAEAALEQSDRQNQPPFVNSYAFTLFAWRDWSYGFMSELARVINERQARDKRTINDIIKYVEQNYMDDLSLLDIASAFFVSREYISRKFKQEFGINFSDYLATYRIDKAKQLMQNPHLKIAQIAEMVGFRDVKYFSKVFKKQEGLSPKAYRSKLEV